MDIGQYKLSCSYLPAFIILLPRRNGFTRNFYSFFFRVFCVSVAKSYFLYCQGEMDLHGIFISLLFPCLLCFRGKTLFLFLPQVTGFTRNFIPFFFRVFCVSVANLYFFSRHGEMELHGIFIPPFFRAFCVSVANFYFFPGTCLINQFTKSFVALKFSNSAGNFLPSIYSL